MPQDTELTHEQQVQLSHYIASVYRQAGQLDADAFRLYCLGQLQQFIQFESGIWFYRKGVEESFTRAETYLFNIPAGFMENYNRLLSTEMLNEDPVGKYAANHVNQSFRMIPEVFSSWDTYIQDVVYKIHSQKFELNNTLTTLYQCDGQDKLNVISLYRMGHGNYTFSAQDKIIKQLVSPHLAEAMTMNILSSFSRQQHHQGVYRAITDIRGNILEAETAFLAMLQRTGQDKITLPAMLEGEVVILALEDGTPIKAIKRHTFVELQLETIPFAGLSPQQIRVCHFLKQGLSDKSIAQHMNISPFTVSNHLKKLYQHLGTKNRLSTVALLLSKDVN